MCPISRPFFSFSSSAVLFCCYCLLLLLLLFLLLSPTTKLGQGNNFRSVCQEFYPQGGHVWQGGMRGRGACVAGG